MHYCGLDVSRKSTHVCIGMRLTQFLVEPGCTPSRAALMTGRHSVRSGLSTIIIGGTPNTLQAGEVTLAELFKGQGYATGYAGKWHLGASEQSWPTRQGFDQYRVGVIETTDGTLYRDKMQRAGMPESRMKTKYCDNRPHRVQPT